MLKHQFLPSFMLLSILILSLSQLLLIEAYHHSPCQGITRLQLNDNQSVINIESPNVPTSYKNLVTCRWSIRQTNLTQRIKLQFDMIDIAQDSNRNHSIGNMIDNQCERQYILVRDLFAVPHLVGKFCGKQIPPAIISAGSTLQIEYRTKGSQSKFKISLSSTE